MLFLLKLACSNLSDGFYYEEKPMNKRKRFPLARKSVSTNQNEGLCWKLLYTRRKKAMTGRNLWKMEKKWSPLAKKLVVHLSCQYF